MLSNKRRPSYFIGLGKVSDISLVHLPEKFHRFVGIETLEQIILKPTAQAKTLSNYAGSGFNARYYCR
jgi:hypothetical protein